MPVHLELGEPQGVWQEVRAETKDRPLDFILWVAGEIGDLQVRQRSAQTCDLEVSPLLLSGEQVTKEREWEQKGQLGGFGVVTARDGGSGEDAELMVPEFRPCHSSVQARGGVACG